MEAEAAVLGAVTIQGALRVLELSLHLFAYIFPKQAIVKDNASYDFIIVGAGSAGCVLANRLSANKDVNVLLIEAGDNPPLEVMMPGLTIFNQRSKYDWNYTSVNDNYAYQCYKDGVFQTSQGHGIGGTSGLNFMLYARGHPNDYKKWAQITDDDTWNYENILPYFKKGERLENWMILNSKYGRFHGTKGEMGLDSVPDVTKIKYMKAIKELGYKTVIDTNGYDTLGFNFPLYSISQGYRQSSCYCYLSPVKERKNLHVLRNTKVNKIIIEENKAIGVEITNNECKSVIKANLEVILSAGAFNSPQLLMLSGIGPQEHLESFDIPTIADLPVGYNLQDHTAVLIAHQTDYYNDKDTILINPFKPVLPTINGFVAINKTQTYPDVQFEIASSVNAEGFVSLLSFLLNLQDDICQIGYEANKEREVAFALVINPHPLSRGRVMLSSADPTDQPKIYLGSFSDDTDLQNFIRYIKEYLRLENTSYFQSVNAQRVDLAGDRCKGFDEDSEEYWRCYILCLMFSMYHYSGTCPMGTVLDSKLRVMGIDGLRVVDASVFPTIPGANINAATSMVAEKAADMIKTDYSI